MTHVASATSQAFLQTRQPAEQDTARPDFQFWHEVFDQAHGNAADSSAHEQGDTHGARHDAQVATRSGFSAHLDAAATGHANQVPQQGSSGAGAGAGTGGALMASRASTLLTPGLLAVPVSSVHGDGLDTGAATALESAQSDELTQRDAAQASLKDAEPESAIRAHVVVNAEGELKVALRAQRGLSVSQALAAVAQAVQQAGESSDQVEQVVLNGERIYQRVSERQTGAKGSSTFELKC